jgi:hypothetical protein
MERRYNKNRAVKPGRGSRRGHFYRSLTGLCEYSPKPWFRVIIINAIRYDMAADLPAALVDGLGEEAYAKGLLQGISAALG